MACAGQIKTSTVTQTMERRAPLQSDPLCHTELVFEDVSHITKVDEIRSAHRTHAWLSVITEQHGLLNTKYTAKQYLSFIHTFQVYKSIF